MGAEIPPRQPEERPFRRDGDFDPNLARFLGQVVRDLKVPMDTVSAKMNGRRGHVSGKFSDPSYQQQPADPFKGIINHRDKPAA